MEKQKSDLDKYREQLHKRANVIAVGVGYKHVNGKRTNAEAIICFVKKKLPESQLSKSDLIPKKLGSSQTDIVEVGEIVAQQNPTEKFRPAPGGVSVGHFAITAGTLGCWVKREGKYYLLSNNHVLANSNNASLGDVILQPGNYDGGKNPEDKIAELHQFVPIDFESANYVDAALANPVGQDNVPPPSGPSNCPVAGMISGFFNTLASFFGAKTRLVPTKFYKQDISDIVEDSILGLGKPTGFSEVSVNDLIVKSGRTTGITHGTVLAVNASSYVNYGPGKTAYFIDQIIASNMSAGGDSGSVVLSEATHNMIGLLFAGSDSVTVINRIARVKDALGDFEI